MSEKQSVQLVLIVALSMMIGFVIGMITNAAISPTQGSAYTSPAQFTKE